MLDEAILAQCLIDRLQARGLPVRRGATPGHLLAFESRFNVLLHQDMSAIFKQVDGMADEPDPANLIRIWPIGKVSPLMAELPQYSVSIDDADHLYVVADYSYSALGYVAKLSSSSAAPGPVFIVGEGAPVQVAACYAEFVGMFLSDSAGLVPSLVG
jgi:hypothetical protein